MNIFRRLEIKAKEFSTKENVFIYPPDKNSFIKLISKERGLVDLKSDTEQILFNENLSKSSKKEKFLRMSLNMMDKEGHLQKAIVWFSDIQMNHMRKCIHLLIGFEYLLIPNEFYCLATIIGYSSETQSYFPCCFILMTSDNCREMYLQIFRYLKDSFKIEPNVIILPLNEHLQKALMRVFSKTIIIGCYLDLLHKLYLFTRQECTLCCENEDLLEHNFFSLIKKSDFRKSDVNKTLKAVLERLNENCQDARYQVLFDELQKLCYQHSDILDYTIIKKVTLAPYDKFIEYFHKTSCFNSDVSLTEFVEKLVKIEESLCQKRNLEFIEISEAVLKDEIEENINFMSLWKQWKAKDSYVLNMIQKKQKCYSLNIETNKVPSDPVCQSPTSSPKNNSKKTVHLKSEPKARGCSSVGYCSSPSRTSHESSADIEIKRSNSKLFDIVKTNRPSFLSN